RIAVADTTLLLVYPHPLPGARALLVSAIQNPSSGSARMGVLDLASGTRRQFGAGVSAVSGARYAAGNIVYSGGSGELDRQHFDPGRLEPTGTREQISILSGFSAGFDVSTGALVYHVGRDSYGPESRTLTLAGTAGRKRVIQARLPYMPRFSPDGRHLLFGVYA